MTTEYRRGVPSTAHVEAATRLGLEWEDDDVGSAKARWRLVVHEESIRGDYATSNTNYSNWDSSPFDRVPYQNSSYRPIRPDGTPVDWEVLDQEVARVGQPQTMACNLTAPAQPRDFRADLWQALSSYLTPGNGCGLLDTVRLDWRGFRVQNPFFTAEIGWPVGFNPTDILARWTVYQELKPLYDLVDGGEGEVSMPRDVEAEWMPGFSVVGYYLSTTARGNLCASGPGEHDYYPTDGTAAGMRLRNFATVLDAVAERRVAERMRTQPPTVPSAPPSAPIGTVMVRDADGTVRPARMNDTARVIGLAGIDMPDAVRPAAQPEPVLDEAALRSLILNLPNVASITSRIERGSRQRDRYIVRVQLVDPNVPLDRALAARIPRNVHVHCEGRGDGGQRGVGGTASSIFSPTGNREDAVAPPIQAPRRVNVEPRRFADVRPNRHLWRWWRIMGAPDAGIIGARFEAMHEQWRWLAMPDGVAPTGNLVGQHSWAHLGVWDARTVIPTDEQGNPVSWEAAGFAAEAVRLAQENVQRAANDATPARSVGDIEWTVTGQPVTRDMTVEPATGMVRSTHTTRIRQLDRLVTEAIQAGNTGNFSIESPTPPRPDQFSNDFIASAPITAESFARVLQQMDGIRGSVMVAATRFAETPQTRALVEAQRAREEAETRARALQQVRGGVERELSGQQISQTLIDDNVDYAPLPRFTADELDDVDHSKTTKLDEVTLRRGKLPTVEQIAKYREVRARRTGGSAADALKESRIDCEVAQYVLERWAGGLGDELALWLLRAVGKYSRSDLRFTQRSVDELAQRELTHEAGAIETAESSPAVQRERQEAEERRQRLAQLRQRLAAERTAQPQEMAKESEVSRFDLIEPDPQADPTASIRAWEARQAAAKVCPMAAPPRIAKPAAAPRRPAIEVVDAEVDGLSRSEAFAALFGRALNGGC